MGPRVLGGPSSQYRIERQSEGYRVAFDLDGVDTEMSIDPQFRILHISATAGTGVTEMYPSFAPTDQGWLIQGFEERAQREGGSGSITTTFTYQDIEGIQIPRSSVRKASTVDRQLEIKYMLSDCHVEKR